MTFIFPEEIEGYSSKEECRYLYDYACKIPKDGVIVELGTYKGRSAISMAQSGRWVVAIDRFEAEERYFFNGYEDHHSGNFHASDVTDAAIRYGVRVWPIAGDSATTVERYKAIGGRKVSLLFIDADHRYDGVTRDFLAWEPMLAWDAVVIFDDVLWEGVARFLQELRDWVPVPGYQAGGMTAMRRKDVQLGIERQRGNEREADLRGIYVPS